MVGFWQQLSMESLSDWSGREDGPVEDYGFGDDLGGVSQDGAAT